MYGPKGEEVSAKDQTEHEAYTAKGYSHTKPVKEVDEPTAQGEKDFKAKHKIKKSGIDKAGVVTKESTISEGTVKTSILDEWDGPGNIQTFMKKAAKKFNVKATFKNGAGNGTAGPDLAIFTGKDEDLIKFVGEYFSSKVSNSKELKAWSENVKNEKRKFKFTKESTISEAKFSPDLIKKAIAIANSRKYQDYYSGAYRAIAKLKKGLEDDPKVLAALKAANESVSEEITITIDEAKKAGKGKTTIDIDWIGDQKLAKDVKKKYKVIVKPTGRTTADITGKKDDIVKMMLDPDVMGFDPGDLEDLFPELFEGIETEQEQSPKQKKYQAFFTKALKKFGVGSPQELEGDKRKEFFDYIDKNWEGENESD